jgi:hypothetical protein
MNRLSVVVGARGALVSLLVAAGWSSAPAAQGTPTFYAGEGFVWPVGSAGGTKFAGFFDFEGDGVLDLANLSQDGVLTVHEKFTEYDRATELNGIQACAITRAGADRIFALQGGKLVEVLQAGGAWQTEEVPGIELDDPSVLKAAERGGQSFLMVIDSAGTRATVVNASTGMSQFFSYQAIGSEAPLYDVEIVNWDAGDADEVALVTQGGLRILTVGGMPIFQLDSDPLGSFVDVLPGEDTHIGQDLLFYQCNLQPEGYSALLAINANHAEMLYVDALDVTEVAFANLSGFAKPELVLSCGSMRTAVIVKQFPTSTPGEPIFWIDWQDVNIIDLAQGAGATGTQPTVAPATAVADLEGDGDEDVLFVDDLGLGQVLVSTLEDANALRAMPNQATSSFPYVQAGVFRYDLALDFPQGVDVADVEVWFQSSPESQALALVHTQTIPSNNPEATLAFPVPQAGGIYQILYRPRNTVGPGLTTYPVYVEYWSPDLSLSFALHDYAHAIYPWKIQEDGPGGTTQRPIINPGGGTGSGGGGGGT